MKKYRISILFFVLGVLLFIISTTVGSHLDANGMLIEPTFFCTPLSYLAFAISCATTFYILFKKRHV